MARVTDAAKQDDKRWMLTPNAWPNWPACPLKRLNRTENGWHQIGLLWAGNGPIVYLVNMFDTNAIRTLNTRPCIKYPTIDALLADGWRID